MAVAWKIDGVIQSQTKRPLPNTARYQTSAVSATVGDTSAVPTKLLYTQRRTAAWYDMHMLKLLDAGVHDVQLCLYMDSVNLTRVRADPADPNSSGTTGHVKLARQRYSFSNKQVDTTTDASLYGIVEKRNAHLLFQRATFGVRSARVLAFGT